MRNILNSLYLFLIIISSNIYSFGQCSMCKATVISNQNETVQNVGGGINEGVLYLMVIPYLLFAGVYYLYKKNYKTN